MEKIYKLTGEDIYRELINLRQVTFEVTDACNLKCAYCGYGVSNCKCGCSYNNIEANSGASKNINYSYAFWTKVRWRP